MFKYLPGKSSTSISDSISHCISCLVLETGNNRTFSLSLIFLCYDYKCTIISFDESADRWLTKLWFIFISLSNERTHTGKVDAIRTNKDVQRVVLFTKLSCWKISYKFWSEKFIQDTPNKKCHCLTMFSTCKFMCKSINFSFYKWKSVLINLSQVLNCRLCLFISFP